MIRNKSRFKGRKEERRKRPSKKGAFRVVVVLIFPFPNIWLGRLAKSPPGIQKTVHKSVQGASTEIKNGLGGNGGNVVGYSSAYTKYFVCNAGFMTC